ncbi:MAG: SAM-dependent chlorinase/fluorinase, partial [Prevotellaceae bacterium]|nr:SAM-dependent chlorinase/fluorinase [Prevotellaceae bacterium]
MPNDRQTVTLTTDWMNKNYYMSAISQTDLPDIYLIGDHYVAQLKGVLRNISQNIEIVDISHSVQAFNVTQAAFVLGNAYKYFPDGTIHLVGVNSEPSPKNRLVAIEKDKHYFVGANNGIFNMMFDTPPDVAYELTPPENLQGFAALAVFAVAVNHIINKRDISLLGQPIDVNIKEIIRPTYSDSSITGSVLFIDHFGNLIT